jgi:hypothetical protein
MIVLIYNIFLEALANLARRDPNSIDEIEV